MTEKQRKYIITKFCGGGANMPPAKNIEIEFVEGYGFGEKDHFGKKSTSIIKLKK
jgi:hypothetical protein